MIKNLKKAFTIIELVIVIAVIAILAAVMIPTYSSLVEKANLSADEQAVKQMNTALAIYTAENGKPESASEVKIGLSENDINADTMEPVTQGYAFYWNPTENKIVLVGPGKAIAQEGWGLLTTTGYGTLKEVSNATEINNAIASSSTTNPALIKLSSDLNLTKTEIIINDGNSVIIDLDKHCLKLESNNVEGKYQDKCFKINGGSLTVKNGNIEAVGRVIENKEGTVVLNHVNISSNVDAGGAVIFCYGISDTSINDCTIESSYGHVIGTNSSDPKADGARISITDSTIIGTRKSAAGINITINTNLTIDGCTISGGAHGIYLRGCTAIIRNSSIYNTRTDGDKEGTKWTDGNNGLCADIVFAAGGGSGYVSTGNYTCENVTGKDGSLDNFAVYVHEPENAEVKVNGVTNYKKFSSMNFDE